MVGRRYNCVNTSNFETHKSRYLQPKCSFFVLLVGFPIAKFLFSIKEWGQKVKFLTILKHWTLPDCTWHSVRAVKMTVTESRYLLVEEEELFYWWKVSKFLLAALFANARRVDVNKFRVENTAILRLRPRKLTFLLFSNIKGFLQEQLTSDYLST